MVKHIIWTDFRGGKTPIFTMAKGDTLLKRFKTLRGFDSQVGAQQLRSAMSNIARMRLTAERKAWRYLKRFKPV